MECRVLSLFHVDGIEVKMHGAQKCRQMENTKANQKTKGTKT